MPAHHRKSHRNPKRNASALSAQALGLKSSQSKPPSAEVQSESPEQPRPDAQPQLRQSRADDADTHHASWHSVAYRQQGITLTHVLLVLCLALASGVANK